MKKAAILLINILAINMLMAQKPYVFSTFPIQKATNLSCYTSIFFTVKFSPEGSNFLPETFIEDNILLYPKGKSRRLIPVKISFNPSIKNVIVKPKELLDPYEDYILEVSNRLKDDRGIPFTPYKLEFKTGECTANVPKIMIIRGEDEEKVPLTPVELKELKVSSFQAMAINDSVEIIWKVKETLLVDEYFVERSSDGKTFRKLTSTPSLGSTQNDQVYTVYDEAPTVGWNYYRLGTRSSLQDIQVLEQTKFYASGIELLKRKIFPAEELPLRFFNARKTSVVVALKSLDTDEVVFRQAKLLEQGTQNLSLPLPEFAPGEYELIIQTSSISLLETIKISY